MTLCFETILEFKELINLVAHSAGVIEYTDCVSAERYDLPTRVLDMTLNNLMVRLQ